MKGVGEMFPSLLATRMESSDSQEILSLAGEGKFLVLDFWTSKCVKCPAALDKLNEEAEKYSDIASFVSVALSQGDGNKELITDLVEDQWENIAHVFMEIDEKEKAKAFFAFTQVPFCVVVSPLGEILASGEPKCMQFDVLFNSRGVSENKVGNVNIAADQVPPERPAFVLDEDF